MNRPLYKSNTDRIISGVCGGISDYFGFNSTIVRIFFFIFFTAMFWVYIALIFVMPSDNL
ncbi:PspC domain-containing protein [Clostridium sp. D46t1_190503_E9]|uniref:PspC domain-containing protein n=1 Tax=Clostridium sp. D46t1_190503_E9 TaxID=2787137 RepID=UPI00189B088A|nr:PspC domain-containing protein [Clostridium sp. D46t1_190503_E9]